MDKPKEVINSEKIILEMQSKVLTLFHALSDKNFNDEVNWIRPAGGGGNSITCLLYTSPSPRDLSTSRMPSSA